MLTIPTFRWLLPIFMLLWKIKAESQNTRIVCYYTNWSVYRPGTAKFNPQNINPYLCTHLIYAFGGFTKENNFKPFDKYQDIEKGGYAKFTGLKTYNKQLKTMLAVGGWNEGSSRFSPMVASPERRKEFVRNAIKFLRQNHFDGLDLDWEYPSFRDGGKPRDKENYALLVQGLREEFERESQKTGRPRLLLTMAVPAGIEYIKKGYDLEKLNKYLDWMNILSYDYHSAFEPSVNHHAPLYSLEEESEYNYDADLNIHHTVQHYLENGVDSEKLVLGIPTYGRSYTLFNPEANEMGAPADGPGDMGDATRENGYLAYYEICEKVKSDGWTVVQPNADAMGPYAYKDNQWVGYDDENIVRKKAEYVAENGLGGIMFWSVDNDDFRGNCFGKPYPLIEAGKEAMIAATSNAISSKKLSKIKPTRNRKPIKKIEDKEENSVVRNSGGKQAGEATSHRTRINALSSRKKGGRRRPTTTTSTISSRSITSTTPKYYTPEPPTTPDSGSDFKCEDEGFFPHPRDCKKYFWCLSSGPSELGIVAHQFTCPSGLYFNKAADSCDYTQNVLCNIKKKAKASSTTAEPSTTTRASTTTAYTTTRRTTTTTTTAPEYDDYEYEDDIIEDEEGEAGGKHTEEDPRVIKELIELIKKAGGIEQLEKQLRFEADGTIVNKSSDSTTPSAISKSLYERVLSRKTAAQSDRVKPNTIAYTLLNRNSRGPQNEGVPKESAGSSVYSKSTPKYTTIQRQRPSTEKPVEEEQEKPLDDEEYVDEEIEDEPVNRELTEAPLSKSTLRRGNHPEYVTISRSRPTTTTPSTTSAATTSSVAASEDPDDDDSKSVSRSTTEASSSHASPEYVTVRRKRPTTSSESSTPQYVTIRGRTTTITNSEETPKETKIVDEKIKESSSKKESEQEQTTVSTASEGGNSIEDSNSINDTKDTKEQKETQDTSTTTQSSPSSSESPAKETKIIPQLSEPTPFLISRRTRPTTTSTTTSSTTAAPKVSPNISSNRLRKRPLKIPSPRPTIEPSNEKLAASLNSLESSNEKSEYENKKALQRRRGGNRFRLHTSESVAANSQNLTPNQVDLSDQIRTFRPDISAELADLSSLTAVDIAITKDFKNNHRRRRPTTTSSTNSPTSQENDDKIKTLEDKRFLSRENLLGNKVSLIESAPLPTKRRRLASRNSDDNEDSFVSTSNTLINRRPLEIKNETETSTENSRRTSFRGRAHRRPRIETASLNSSSPTAILEETSSTRTNRNGDGDLPKTEGFSTKPRRKVIRRLLHRTTTPSVEEKPITTTTEKQTTTEKVETTSVENITDEIPQIINEDKDTSSTENVIPNSSSDLPDNTTTSSEPLIESDKKEVVASQTEENTSDEEEEENIKLSETIISESKNTDFNRNDFFGVGSKNIDPFGKDPSEKTLGKEEFPISQTKEDNTDKETTTEGIKFNRRRKVIRKFSTTEFPTTAVSSSIDDFGQRTQPRKIIRRLRPQGSRFNALGLNEKTENSEKPETEDDTESTSKKYLRRPSLFLRNKQLNAEKKNTFSLEYLNRPSTTEATTKSDVFRRYSRRPYSSIQRTARPFLSSTTDFESTSGRSTTASAFEQSTEEDVVEVTSERNINTVFPFATTTDDSIINFSSTFSLEDIFAVTPTTDSNLDYSTEVDPSTEANINLSTTVLDTEETTTLSNELLKALNQNNAINDTGISTELSEIPPTTTTDVYIEASTFETPDKTYVGQSKEIEIEDNTTLYDIETTTAADINASTTASSTSETTTISTTSTTVPTTTTTSKPFKNRLYAPNSLRPKLKLTQKSNPLFLKISEEDKDKAGDKRPQFRIYNSRYGGARKPVTSSILNESRNDEDENSSNHGREENDIEEENGDKIENDSNVSKEVLDDEIPKDLKSTSTQKPRFGFRPSFTRKPPTGFKAKTSTTSTESPSTSTANILKALDARNKFLSSNSRRYKNPLHRQSNSTTESHNEPQFATAIQPNNTTSDVSSTNTTVDEESSANTTIGEVSAKSTTIGEVFSAVSTTTESNNVTVENETTTAKYHHVFEQNGNITNIFGDNATETVANVTEVTAPTKKLEKLIEVNRIVKVSLKKDTDDSSEAKEVTLLPSLDKIGSISRLKVVNVVDGTRSLSDGPTIHDPASSQLIFDPNLLSQVATDKYLADEIHIDSKSMVHTFTAKPPHNFESATIPLEGLFNYRPFKEGSLDEEEALETENSHRVTVRVVQPKAPVREEKKIEPYMFAHPMNIVHESGALRAKVVEITPEFNSETIRIAPIAVSLGEKLSSQKSNDNNKETTTNT